MRSAQDLPFDAAQLAFESAPGVPGDLAELRRSFAALVSNAEARAQAQPETAEWLPMNQTDADELGRLAEAAARIRHARNATHRHASQDRCPDFASMPAAELWEQVVAHAAREASRVSAQLAQIGLDIGSIALVREKPDNKTLHVFFRDGHEVRPPGLVIAAFRDGSIRHEWIGRDPEPGSLDLSLELTPQLRRLVLRLCDLVAHEFANDARLALQTPGGSAPAL